MNDITTVATPALLGDLDGFFFSLSSTLLLVSISDIITYVSEVQTYVKISICFIKIFKGFGN